MPLILQVLLQKGHSALVENGRQVTDKGGKVKQLGTLMTKPLSRFNVVSSWLIKWLPYVFPTLESSGQRCSLSSHLAFEFHSLSWNRFLLRVSIVFLPKLHLLSLLLTSFFTFDSYNGYKAGPGFHARYFQLKDFDKDRRQAFIKKRRGAYLMLVSLVLS